METTELALAAAGIVLMAIPGWILLHHSRTQMRLHYARLEETLRVYNNANVAIGRHLGGLESELRELRQRLAVLEGAGARPGMRGEAACTTATDLEVVDDAELRLSRLIRSRLGESRAVV